MKRALEEILGEFYENGIQDDVHPRRIPFGEQPHSISVVTGMRRTGKTYLTYQRIQEQKSDGNGKGTTYLVNVYRTLGQTVSVKVASWKQTADIADKMIQDGLIKWDISQLQTGADGEEYYW